MTHRMRYGRAIAVAVAMLLIASSAATAAVQLNGGPIMLTATARNPVMIESTGSGAVVNCSSSQIRGTVQSNGTGTITTGNAMFGSCVLVGHGAITFTHLSDWSIATDFLLDGSGRIIGVSATLTLPPGSALLTIGTCRFQLSGTVTSLQSLTPTTPPALVSISSLPFGSMTLGLVVSNATAGCSGTGVADRDQARINGTYLLSSTLTGTLVP